MKQDSKRLTSAIIAALLLVTALVVYFEMILPAYALLQTDKGQEMGEANLLANEQSVVSEVSSTLATYNSEASTTEAVNMALPVGQNVAGALAQLYGIGVNTGFDIQSTGISIQAIQQSASTASIGSVASVGGSIVRPSGTVTFQIQGSGTYESLKSFLMGLQNNIRLFNVTAISIQPIPLASTKSQLATQDLFNYTLTVVTYYQSS